MVPLGWLILILVVCVLMVFAVALYQTERNFNDAERKYGVRPPRRHWWLP